MRPTTTLILVIAGIVLAIGVYGRSTCPREPPAAASAAFLAEQAAAPTR